MEILLELSEPIHEKKTTCFLWPMDADADIIGIVTDIVVNKIIVPFQAKDLKFNFKFYFKFNFS